MLSPPATRIAAALGAAALVVLALLTGQSIEQDGWKWIAGASAQSRWRSSLTIGGSGAGLWCEGSRKRAAIRFFAERGKGRCASKRTPMASPGRSRSSWSSTRSSPKLSCARTYQRRHPTQRQRPLSARAAVKHSCGTPTVARLGCWAKVLTGRTTVARSSNSSVPRYESSEALTGPIAKDGAKWCLLSIRVSSTGPFPRPSAARIGLAASENSRWSRCRFRVNPGVPLTMKLNGTDLPAAWIVLLFAKSDA